MKKLEDVFEEDEVKELVNQEVITEDPPQTGRGTGAPDKGRK